MRTYLRLRPHVFDSYLQPNTASDIILRDPTVAGVSFCQRADANENGGRARVVWLAPAVIRRSSSSNVHDPEQEFRVCLFEKQTLEPVHVRDRTGRPALWGLRYLRLGELAQLAEQGDTANIPRASSLARVFLRSNLWYDAVRAWDTETQEQFDRSIISGKHPPSVLQY